ncbi:dermonecrotic toxin SPH-like [Ixodes scapularis]|uniref:dermonecrotic toxin SPH-like n=1 Tax=Ixodes scapularis TaxID=6945 RepID=UPI001A9CD39C|nr:dermonecrotic toxin SPH-like [Ixodes scapularis]
MRPKKIALEAQSARPQEQLLAGDTNLKMPSNQAMNVILSIESADEKEILRSAITAIQNHDSTLLNRLGFDVGQSSSMEDVGDMYAELNITGHRWYDQGITNCLNFLFDTNQLEAPIANREADDATSFVDKTYFWTTDLKSSMREVLRLGVDGILTNKPEFVIEVLNEDEFKQSVRLANAEDNPWMRIP